MGSGKKDIGSRCWQCEARCIGKEIRHISSCIPLRAHDDLDARTDCGSSVAVAVALELHCR